MAEMRQNRLSQLRKSMRSGNHGAVLITNPTNRFYMTGFDGSSGIVLITLDNAWLITDFRYREQVKHQVSGFDIIISDGRDHLFRSLGERISGLGVKRLSIEPGAITYDHYLKLQQELGDVELLSQAGMIEKLRMVKDEVELTIMRKAAQIADDTFAAILSEVSVGMSEIDVSNRLEFLMRERGAESSSFGIIVASGERSALPHGRASNKQLEWGDLVTLDFGALYDHYCSDMTRTFMLGEPSPQQQEIYEVVKEAQRLASLNLKPGLSCQEGDRLARDYIESHNYGEYFGHGTGHGLGLDVHEAPRLAKSDATKLEPGMIVTVEPGIYIPGLGGVRIEDDILITEAGCESLTHSPRELVIIT